LIKIVIPMEIELSIIRTEEEAKELLNKIKHIHKELKEKEVFISPQFNLEQLMKGDLSEIFIFTKNEWEEIFGMIIQKNIGIKFDLRLLRVFFYEWGKLEKEYGCKICENCISIISVNEKGRPFKTYKCVKLQHLIESPEKRNEKCEDFEYKGLRIHWKGEPPKITLQEFIDLLR